MLKKFQQVSHKLSQKGTNFGGNLIWLMATKIKFGGSLIWVENGMKPQKKAVLRLFGATYSNLPDF